MIGANIEAQDRARRPPSIGTPVRYRLNNNGTGRRRFRQDHRRADIGRYLGRHLDRTDVILALAIFAIAAVFQFSRLSSAVDSELTEQWFGLFPGTVTNDLVVVEIDSRSIRAFHSWPWPRTYHAEVIDRLSEAGAIVIGVDIDFSSYSDLAADLDLVTSIAQNDTPVVLPVFRQLGWVAPGQSGIIEALPIPELAHNATLAHVNVQPDPDGIVRRHTMSASFSSTGVLPSMALALAATPAREPSFVLDFSIPVNDVTRISFVDLYRGNFEEASIAGKHVLIGATAVELGDQLSVPVHVTLPGVMVHALAFETLRQGRALVEVAPELVVVGSLLLAAVLLAALRRMTWRFALVTASGTAMLVLSAAAATQAVLATIVPVVPWLLVIALAFVAAVLSQIDGLMEQLLRKAMALLHRTSMMNSVVNDTSDGILIADRQGTVSFANPALKAMLGLDEDELNRRHLALWFADLTGLWHDHGAALSAERPVLSGSVKPAECRVDAADGSTIVVEVRAAYSRLSAGRRRTDRELEQTGIFTLRDITARKKLEEAQAAALVEATSASESKTNFLANMNHELRTPLNAIIGFSEVMRDQVFGPLGSDSYLEYADSIRESGRRLLATVNDVMEAARIDSGSYELDEDVVDVAALILDAACALEDAAQAKGVSLAVAESQDGLRLRCDPDALTKTLGKIVDNAVKFNKPDGSADISYRTLRKGGLEIEISDTGIGLSEDDVARILQPFGQADAALNRKFEGAGLGLTIANGLMRLHGGSIDITSSLDVGTTVTLTFPAERVVTE